MRIPFFNPWATMGAIAPIDAIERQVKAYRKAKTEREKRSALALIKSFATDVEAHVDDYIARGGFPRPPRRIVERSLDELQKIADTKSPAQRMPEQPINEDR